MKRQIEDYLEDIIEAMNNAIIFTKDMSFNEFIIDVKTTYAVIR